MTAAAGGIASAMKAISRCGLCTPGMVSGASGALSVSARKICVSKRVRPSWKRCGSKPKYRMVTITINAASAAAHATSRPGGYHSSWACAPLPPTGRASMAR